MRKDKQTLTAGFFWRVKIITVMFLMSWGLTACVSFSPSKVDVVEKGQQEAYCRPDLREDKIIRNLSVPYENRYYLLEPGELCTPN